METENLQDDTADPGATSKIEPDLASSAAKMTLRAVKETSDAFPPLKSAAPTLCFILDNYEVLSAFELVPLYMARPHAFGAPRTIAPVGHPLMIV